MTKRQAIATIENLERQYFGKGATKKVESKRRTAEKELKLLGILK